MHDILDFALAAESISSASTPHRQIVDRFLQKAASAAPSGPLPRPPRRRRKNRGSEP